MHILQLEILEVVLLIVMLFSAISYFSKAMYALILIIKNDRPVRVTTYWLISSTFAWGIVKILLILMGHNIIS